MTDAEKKRDAVSFSLDALRSSESARAAASGFQKTQMQSIEKRFENVRKANPDAGKPRGVK